MNDEAFRPERHRSQFLRKFDRYRVLLLQKWWLPLLGILLGIGVAGAFSWFGPPSFTSVGKMIVSIKLSIPEGSVYSEEMSGFLGTQSALMQSGIVVNRARARVAVQLTNAAPQSVALQVGVQPKTTIFVLQATGNEAQYTAAFLQACMEEYSLVKKEMRAQTSDTTLAGLTEEILRLERELRKSDDELSSFQSTNSVTIFQEQGNSAVTYLTGLTQRLAALKSEYELLQTLTLDENLQRRQLPNDLPPSAGDPGDKPASTSEATDSDYLKAKQQILLLKAEQQDLAQFLRPKHPKMVAMSAEIARRERLLAIFRQQSAEQLESHKKTLALQIENLEKDVQEWDAQALAVSRKSAEYHRLKANAQRTQALYDRLLSTMQTLDVNRQVSPESVTIMENASPAFPDKPTLSRQSLTGALVGLGLSLAVLLLLDRLDDRMHSFLDLGEVFDEQVLGQIPRQIPANRHEELKLLEFEDERHAFAEAYRNLRSSLLYMESSGQRPKTLLVTSSIPNDGKSLTSANVALTMASAGSRVLLVDADLRRGALHHRFGRKAEPGLSEVLSQGFNWEQAVQSTKAANLCLLPRGRPTQASSELFISNVTATFLQAASEKYDYVILDAAPVMAADDVTSLAPRIDGVLFVIRAGSTSARVARAALDLLYQRQVNVLGLVFNAVRSASSNYYYYKYEDYYRAYPSNG